MPKRVPKHVTGDRAVGALQVYFVNLGWTFETVEKDYGLDAKVEVFKNDQARAFIFFIQSKGTEIEVGSKRQIAEYFDESEVNYFIELNNPILIVKYSIKDRALFAKWAYSNLSFKETETRYKVVFSTSDILIEENTQCFMDSVEFLENISQLSSGKNIEIEFSGNVSDTLYYTRFFSKWVTAIGLPFSIVESSPVKFIFSKKSISLRIFGIINEIKSSNLNNLLSILEVLTSGISEKYGYQVEILQTIYGRNLNKNDIIRLANNFRDDINYLPLINNIEEDEQGFLEIFRPIISILQLNYFYLSREVKDKIKKLREKKYILTRSANDLLNYLLVLQSENNQDEMSYFLNEMKPHDEFFTLNERMAVEYANFAYKIDDNEEALRVINLCASDDEDVIYLKARLLIKLGFYKDSMAEFQKIGRNKSKSTDYLILYTMASLLVKGLGIEKQFRTKNEDTLTIIDSHEQAIKYIRDYDALEPTAWIVIARKTPNNVSGFNEPEYYTAFSSLFSKAPEHFAQSIGLFIEKIYYDETADIESLRFVLTNMIEEALITFGREFLDDVLEMLIGMDHTDEIINDVARNINKIEAAHVRLNKSTISDKGSGIIGNTIYRPSILSEE